MSSPPPIERGRPGTGRPRLFSNSTAPPSAGTFELPTDSTSLSGLIGGGAAGASPAPAGVARNTRPATPATVPAAANDSAVFLEFITYPSIHSAGLSCPVSSRLHYGD